MKYHGAPHGSRTHKVSQGTHSNDLASKFKMRVLLGCIRRWLANEGTKVKSGCGKPTAFGEFSPDKPTPFRRPPFITTTTNHNHNYMCFRPRHGNVRWHPADVLPLRCMHTREARHRGPGLEVACGASIWRRSQNSASASGFQVVTGD